MDDNSNWSRSLPGELLERWPRDEGGAPEQPAWLCNCKNLDFSDELTMSMLEAYGIPCLRLYPGDGGFGRLILGMSGQGSDIYVPASLLEDARQLCESRPEEPEEQ